MKSYKKLGHKLGENICNHILKRGLVSRIYKELKIHWLETTYLKMVKKFRQTPHQEDILIASKMLMIYEINNMMKSCLNIIYYWNANEMTILLVEM